jgi:membrane-anchored protein YejM (alkaline phosphatase superfamily)
MYSKEHPRGPEWLVWSIFFTLKLGLLLRVVFEPLQSLSPSTLGGWALVAAAILQWFSGVGFAIAVWTRIRRK